MVPTPYIYNAHVTSIYDGDTITVDIDLGLDTWRNNERIRLYGIDTPEVRGDEREQGLVSRDWLRGQILDCDIVLQTIKDRSGKYGRLLGIVWYNGENINEALVKHGLAEVVEY